MKFIASRNASLNTFTSFTMWSLGVTTMFARGLRFFIFQLTYAMHGAVFLLHGSRSMFSAGNSGNCSRTRFSYILDVTTHVFSMGQRPENLSNVICSNDRPTPSTSRNCFGRSALLMGQKRLPMPPAIITK